MFRYVVAYFLTLIVFFAIDFIWLGTVAKSFYRNEIGPLLLEKFNISVAVFFYVMYITGVIIFAVGPSLKGGVALERLAVRCPVRFLHLCDLRLYQPGHAQRVHAETSNPGYRLGTCLVAASAVAGAWLTRLIFG